MAADQHQVLERARRVLKARHYKPKTIKAYLFWIERFIRFLSPRDLDLIQEREVNEFLTNLAVKETSQRPPRTRRFQRCCFYSTKCWEGHWIESRE